MLNKNEINANRLYPLLKIRDILRGESRTIKFKLKWNADGRYFPVSITMDAESAVVFRLVFNV